MMVFGRIEFWSEGAPMEWEAIRKHPNDYAGANLQSVPASISEPSEGMRNSAIASPSCLPDSRFGRCDDGGEIQLDLITEMGVKDQWADASTMDPALFTHIDPTTWQSFEPRRRGRSTRGLQTFPQSWLPRNRLAL